MKKKILILGISSFAGYTFAKYMLKKKYYVYGTYNSNIKIFSDIKKNKNLKLFKINLEKNYSRLFQVAKKINPFYIVDFSSICMVNESWSYPEKYLKINCISKLELIKNINLIKNLKKFLYISTPEVFGKTKKNLTENFKLFNPSTPYASTKLLIENLIRNYQSSNNKKFIIARFSNFYGPGQPLYRLIPKLIISIKKKIKFTIHGNGLSKRNFIFSDDFCNGIFMVLKKVTTGKSYHFSSETLYTVKQVVCKVCRLMNVDFNATINFGSDRIGKDDMYKLDCRKTKKELNWKCKTSLEKGIVQTIRHIEKNYKFLKNYNINFEMK